MNHRTIALVFDWILVGFIVLCFIGLLDKNMETTPAVWFLLGLLVTTSILNLVYITEHK